VLIRVVAHFDPIFLGAAGKSTRGNCAQPRGAEVSIWERRRFEMSDADPFSLRFRNK
jgi:hypothetical protein